MGRLITWQAITGKCDRSNWKFRCSIVQNEVDPIMLMSKGRGPQPNGREAGYGGGTKPPVP